MITKTEVLKAIADCEAAGGWGPLDNTPATVSRGALHVLVEAAKCARYKAVNSGVFEAREVSSASDLVLTDDPKQDVLVTSPDLTNDDRA